DGSVVSWGMREFGSDSYEVRDLLYDVRHVEASYGAFAALCGAEGRVVTWGNPLYGGSRRGTLKTRGDLGSSGVWRRQPKGAGAAPPRRGALRVLRRLRRRLP
ncbi:unnamed protein product, partial [Durusdinium trenchii]